MGHGFRSDGQTPWHGRFGWARLVLPTEGSPWTKTRWRLLPGLIRWGKPAKDEVVKHEAQATSMQAC